VIWGLLLACQTPWEESQVDGLRLLTHTVRPGPDGRAKVDVEVQDGETALLFTVDAGQDVRTWLMNVWNPDGELVVDAKQVWEDDNNRATAAFSDHTVTLPLPLDALAPALAPGVWRFDVRANDVEATLDLAVVLTTDPPGDDVLKVDLYATPGLEAGWLAALDGAVDHWADTIYAPVGVTLDVARLTTDAATRLSPPGGDDAATYAAIAAARALNRVPVLLLTEIRYDQPVLGLAGGIPGPLVATGSTAVAINVGEGAGRDGRYDAQETDLLGETLAHEVGHFLGLFHPMEIPEGDQPIASWDSLPDTPECAGFDACIQDLGDNLMFPTPVCTGDCSTFVSQTLLTANQVDTARGNPAAR
jgi:hypothetical protein